MEDRWQGKGSEEGKSTYRLSENGVSVTRNDLSRLEGSPDVLLDLLVGSVGSNGVLHAENESEDFLVSESVKGTGETTESGGVGEEGVREGGSDEICHQNQYASRRGGEWDLRVA